MLGELTVIFGGFNCWTRDLEEFEEGVWPSISDDLKIKLFGVNLYPRGVVEGDSLPFPIPYEFGSGLNSLVYCSFTAIISLNISSTYVYETWSPYFLSSDSLK